MGEHSKNDIPKILRDFVYGNTHDAMVILRGERFVAANETAVSLCGFQSESELLGTSVRDLVEPQYVPIIVDRMARRSAGNPPTESQAYECVRPNGETFFAEISGLTWQVAPELTVYIIKDVTKREADIEALRESERLYRTLADTVPAGVMLEKPGPGRVYVNKVAQQITGYSEQELLDGVRLAEPEDTVILTRRNAALYYGTPFNNHRVRYLRKDGTRVWVSVSGRAIHAPDGSPQLMHVIFTDISERVATEEALTRSEDLFKRLARSTADIIWEIDSNGVFQYVSEGIRTLGYVPEEIIGRRCMDLIPDEEKSIFADDFAQALCANEPQVYELDAVARDGSRLSLESTGEVVRENGIPIRLQGIARDISERKQTQRLLQQQRDLAVALLGCATLEEALPLCVEAAMRVSGLDCGGVYVPNSETGALDLIYVSGMSNEFVSAARIIEAGSPIHKVVMSKEPVYTSPGEDIVPAEVWELGEITCGAIIPVVAGGRIIADFHLASHTLSEAPPDIRPALESIASLCGSAIERIKSEEARARADDLFRRLAENTADIIWELDPDLRVRYVSEGVKQLGYEPESLIGRNATEFVGPELVPHLPAAFAEIAHDPLLRVHEASVPGADGSMIALESIVDIVQEEGKIVRIQGIARDISERKRSEMIAASQHELVVALSAAGSLDAALPLIVDAAMEVSAMDCGGVYLTDESSGDLVLTYFSGIGPEFAEGTRVAPAGSLPHEMIMRGEPIFAATARTADFGDAWIKEGLKYAVMTPIKSEGDVIGSLHVASHTRESMPEDAKSAVESTAGQCGSFIARLRAEADLVRTLDDLQNAYDVQRQFLNNVTHEVRTPLTAVQGYAEMLLEGVAGPLSDEQAALLRKVLAGSEHLISVVNNVLEIARLKSGTSMLRPKAAKPCEIVEKAVVVVQPQANRKGISISTSFEHKDRMAMYEVEKLATILVNLLGNAVKFTEMGAIDVVVDAREEYVEVTIADTGIGIDPEKLDSIFDEFTQLPYPGKHKPSGFGIGLSIVETMVRTIGATLTVSSVPGMGTAFTLHAPSLRARSE